MVLVDSRDKSAVLVHATDLGRHRAEILDGTIVSLGIVP
jgi:hypothetical protein